MLIRRQKCSCSVFQLLLEAGFLYVLRTFACSAGGLRFLLEICFALYALAVKNDVGGKNDFTNGRVSCLPPPLISLYKRHHLQSGKKCFPPADGIETLSLACLIVDPASFRRLGRRMHIKPNSIPPLSSWKDALHVDVELCITESLWPAALLHLAFFLLLLA